MPAPTDVSTSTTYTPVQYDVDENKLSAISPEAFYGSLLDENKPSTIFCYLTDALFFHIDTHCDVPGLRGTGVIEPEKLVWMKKTMGMGDEAASVLSMNLLLLYKTARVPYHGITSSSGDNVPTLDRRAFLHLAVFEAQAAPNETFGVR
ncbi:hypothetical protein PHLCEN_2v10886 [Hermanssonia centrifuga]|uniref:DUF7514 domain-containing protein n=1 Tax=Hermanssonia centrifuga TaxID=98765 RepID=A0A2R6NLX9_9APHY|nr:hypothetical protein PHLCEN_2v10886 [Hermanssonia centrifuga]